jgi:neutral ceramidase
MKSLFRCAFVFALTLLVGHAAPAPLATPWRVGVASRKLTPPGPIWLAGYANRAAPSDGVAQDIFGKALALDDGAGGRLVIVTLDLIGVPATLRAHTEKAAAEKFGLKPHEILLNASHNAQRPAGIARPHGARARVQPKTRNRPTSPR